MAATGGATGKGEKMIPGNVGAMLNESPSNLYIVRAVEGDSVTIEDLKTKDEWVVFASDFWVLLDSL
jgi:hypothetical protein